MQRILLFCPILQLLSDDVIRVLQKPELNGWDRPLKKAPPLLRVHQELKAVRFFFFSKETNKSYRVSLAKIFDKES